MANYYAAAGQAAAAAAAASSSTQAAGGQAAAAAAAAAALSGIVPLSLSQHYAPPAGTYPPSGEYRRPLPVIF